MREDILFLHSEFFVHVYCVTSFAFDISLWLTIIPVRRGPWRSRCRQQGHSLVAQHGRRDERQPLDVARKQNAEVKKRMNSSRTREGEGEGERQETGF